MVATKTEIRYECCCDGGGGKSRVATKRQNRTEDQGDKDRAEKRECLQPPPLSSRIPRMPTDDLYKWLTEA
jgi:hypothetical protein